MRQDSLMHGSRFRAGIKKHITANALQPRHVGILSTSLLTTSTKPLCSTDDARFSSVSDDEEEIKEIIVTDPRHVLDPSCPQYLYRRSPEVDLSSAFVSAQVSKPLYDQFCEPKEIQEETDQVEVTGWMDGSCT